MSVEHEDREERGRAIAAAESVNTFRNRGAHDTFVSKVRLGTLVGALFGGLAGMSTMDPVNVFKGMGIGAGVGATIGAGVHGLSRIGGR